MPSSRGGSGKVAVYHRKPSGPHNTSVAVIPPSGDVVEVNNEDEWITRRRVEVITTKNIETRVQRQLLVDEDGNVVEDSGPIVSTDTTVDTQEKKDENTEHKKNPDERGVPEGYVAVPGGAVVSERFTNITNTHEERDDVREEEEVHHLGQYSNEEISRAIRDGRDARALVRQRQGSGPSGQLVDPRNGQRRVVHQAGKTWRTVDTEDIHEKTRQDEHGELVTETARTAQQEQFQNITVPEDGSDCSAEEQHRTTSRHRRHVKDEDMLEYYSVPKGGRLGDGIKLGEGLRYVQENVEEDREGDDNIESLSERMRRLRQLGYKPEGQTLAKTPIEYQEEEKTRRKETHKWLDSHFGSESGQSGSSEDGESRRRAQGRDEVDRPQAGAYEFQTSSARRADQTQTGTWQRSEQYSKQVRQTPEHTYVKETRQTPRGEFERVQVTPVGASPGPRRSSLVSTDTRGESEDPIFASKFSSGKPRGNVRFQAASPERRPVDSGRLSPPTQSPPPPPPPRHRRKGRDKESPLNAPNDNHYASSPIRERYERDSRNGIGSDDRRSERRQVKEYHFGSGSPRSSDRDRASSSRFEQREQQSSSRHGSYSDDRDGSLRRHGVETSRGRTASIDELSSSRQSDAERRVRYHHRSTDFLDRRGSEERRAPPERVTFESRTLPRRPHEHAASPVTRAPDAGRFGGSMINVSLRSAGRGAAPQKPARSPIQRSNSLYSKDGQDGAFNAGLKSPDIISKIQRTASMRRGDGGEAAPEQERMSHTSSSSRSYRASPAAPPQPPGKKDSFMRGLLKNAPELYSVLHGNERKDSKTPSPRSGLITPPPPLERVTPAGGSALSRSERLRSEDSRSGRSYTPSDDTYRGGADRPSIVKVNVRHSAEREGSPRSARLVNGVSAGAAAHPADTPIHYRYNDEIYTSPSRRDEIYTSPSRRGEWSEERSTSERSREDRPGGGRRRNSSPTPESPLVARVRAWHRASAAAPT